MACFFVSLVGMSFVYHWLRLRSGSVWPAVLMHASHNAAITLAFSALTADTGRTAWWIDEFGALLAVVSILMALVVSRLPCPVEAP
jgi:membrane protease YdiL (CAAX protease family)